MRSRRMLVLLITMCSLAGIVPSPVVARSDDPATRYDKCITSAERSLYDCLDFAVATEQLCWSRYGYAKLYCSIRYAVDLIVK